MKLVSVVANALTRVSKLVLISGLAIASVTAFTTAAHAQPGRGGGMGMMGGMFGGMGGMGQGMEASYTSRDIDRASEILGFDNGQKEAVKVFFDAYQASFQDEAAKFREKMDKAREAFNEDRDPAVWDGVRKAGEELRAKREKLDAEFNENIKSVCTDAQKPNWPKYERVHRREAGLDRNSFLSGERVNLFTLTEKIEMPSENKAQVTNLLDQYDVELDRELVNREKVQKELMEEGQKLFSNIRGFQDIQNLDGKKINALIEKGREASIRVRDVNRRFFKQIAAALPADKKTGFEEEFQKQSYPMVYRQTRAQRSLDAAIGFGDLTAEQKTAVETIRTNYLRDLATLNTQAAEAQEKQEMEMSFEKMMNFMNQDDPAAQIRTKKRELGDKSLESLKATLNEEQIKRLPAGEEQPEGPRRGGGGGGGGGGRNRDRS